MLQACQLRSDTIISASQDLRPVFIFVHLYVQFSENCTYAENFVHRRVRWMYKNHQIFIQKPYKIVFWTKNWQKFPAARAKEGWKRKKPSIFCTFSRMNNFFVHTSPRFPDEKINTVTDIVLWRIWCRRISIQKGNLTKSEQSLIM